MDRFAFRRKDERIAELEAEVAKVKGELEGMTFPVDGLSDSKDPGIVYWGQATYVNGHWECLANVHGNLCRVEVKLRTQPASELVFASSI